MGHHRSILKVQRWVKWETGWDTHEIPSTWSKSTCTQNTDSWISRTGFPAGTVVKNPPANAGDARDAGWIPGSGRSPGDGSGNPLQYSCLENSMDRGAWWVTVHGVTKSQTDWAHTHIQRKDAQWTNQNGCHWAGWGKLEWGLRIKKSVLIKS